MRSRSGLKRHRNSVFEMYKCTILVDGIQRVKCKGERREIRRSRGQAWVSESERGNELPDLLREPCGSQLLTRTTTNWTPSTMSLSRVQRPLARSLRTVSTWSAVPAGPPDPILGGCKLCINSNC